MNYKCMPHGTGSIPVGPQSIIEGGFEIMEIIVNGIIGATISNFMKDYESTKNTIIFWITVLLASVCGIIV